MWLNDAEKAVGMARPASVDEEKADASFEAFHKEGIWRKFFIDFLCVAANTLTTILLVIVNKRYANRLVVQAQTDSGISVFSDPQLRKCQLTTAAWHFVATSLVLWAASARPFSMFTAIRLPVLEILPISLLFVGFLILGNLSLALNPVAFYQMARILTAPCVVAINYFCFGQTIPFASLAAITVSCFGVMLTVSDFAFSNVVGTIAAVLSFVVTAFYQIWIGKRIGDLNVSPVQLLMNQAPLSVVVLSSLVPFIDTKPDFATLDSGAVQLFIVSGFLAAGLNLSQFLIIGRTSALTFNIVSNVKNIVIISYGWHQAHKAIGLLDIGGISLALGGAFMYSWLCQRYKQS
jgi:solute carrier family 35, member E3